MSDTGLGIQPPEPLPSTGPTTPPAGYAMSTGEPSETRSAGSDSTRAVAADQAKQVASSAAGRAREVVGEARQQVSEVAGEAKTQAREVVKETSRQLHDQASQQTDRAAQGLRTLTEQIQALTSGRPQEAGPAADYARQLGNKVSQLAARMESGGFDGIVEDTRRFARRRPGVFLLGAAAAGFAVGRLVRASTGGGADDPTSSDMPGWAATAGVAALTAAAPPSEHAEAAGYATGATGASQDL